VVNAHERPEGSVVNDQPQVAARTVGAPPSGTDTTLNGVAIPMDSSIASHSGEW
jgi:hypothetical protein